MSRDNGYMDQAPAPYRIVDDMGSAFAMGAIGGGVWYGIKGARNSPKGDRLHGAFQAVKLRAPTLGSNFAAWGGWFSVFDCGFAYVRHTEDAWNSIASGAATGGLLAARAGLRQAGKSALVGGVLLGLIEGLSHLISNSSMSLMKPIGPDGQPMPGPPPYPVPHFPAFKPLAGHYGNPQPYLYGPFGFGPYGSAMQPPPIYAAQPAIYAYESQQQMHMPPPPGLYEDSAEHGSPNATLEMAPPADASSGFAPPPPPAMGHSGAGAVGEGTAAVAADSSAGAGLTGWISKLTGK